MSLLKELRGTLETTVAINISLLTERARLQNRAVSKQKASPHINRQSRDSLRIPTNCHDFSPFIILVCAARMPSRCSARGSSDQSS